MRALAVTLYQGRAGDHNPRALVGARVLGQALADRLGVDPVVVGEPSRARQTLGVRTRRGTW